MMDIRVSKQKGGYEIAAVRGDGTASHIRAANKGWFPHDLVHFVVEKHLGLSTGF